jgi:uncharacterized membrane protein YheB (UPF0754 family)
VRQKKSDYFTKADGKKLEKSLEKRLTKNLTKNLTRDLTTNLTRDLTTNLTRDLTTSLTRDLTTSLTRDLTTSLTRDLTDKLSVVIDVKMDKKLNEIRDDLKQWRSEMFDIVDGLALEVRDNREFREITTNQIVEDRERIGKLEKRVFGTVV